MKLTQIKITDDGLSGQAVNPYSKEVANWASENYRNYITFAKDNPPHPLTFDIDDTRHKIELPYVYLKY